jgi:hypothetical protein
MQIKTAKGLRLAAGPWFKWVMGIEHHGCAGISLAHTVLGRHCVLLKFIA